MKTFRWKVKPDMEVNSQPSVREVRFGDGYSQRMAAGLNADLKTYSVTLSVPREEATVLESFLEEHGCWKAFLWTPPPFPDCFCNSPLSAIPPPLRWPPAFCCWCRAFR